MTHSLPDTRDEPMAHSLGIGFVRWIAGEQALFGVNARDLHAGPDQEHNAVADGWMGQHKSAERQQIRRVDRVAEIAIQPIGLNTAMGGHNAKTAAEIADSHYRQEVPTALHNH